MTGKRLGAAIGGGLAMLLVTVVTLGTALLAPLGMWISTAIQRRNNEPSTRFTTWLGAILTVGMVFTVGMWIVVGTTTVKNENDPAYRRMRDSIMASSAKRPTPAWMEKIAPGTAARRARAEPVAPGSKTTTAFAIGGGIFGGVMIGTLLGLLIGSLGWAAALPLYYAMYGKRIGEQTLPEDEYPVPGTL
jgi:hypothetical protein